MTQSTMIPDTTIAIDLGDKSRYIRVLSAAGEGATEIKLLACCGRRADCPLEYPSVRRGVAAGGCRRRCGGSGHRA